MRRVPSGLSCASDAGGSAAFCKPNIGIATWSAIAPSAGSVCSCSRSRQPIRCSRSPRPATAFALLLVLPRDRSLRCLVNPVLGVTGLKILVDFAFHLAGRSILPALGRARGAAISFAFSGLLAALLEPFSFQILRHLAAAWGWGHFPDGRARMGHPAPPRPRRCALRICARARRIRNASVRPVRSKSNSCFHQSRDRKD